MKMLNKKRQNHKKNNNQYDTFLSKLFDILNDETFKDIIKWSKDGYNIIITDVNKLCEVILPKFYKHRNFSSFVRQLNLYDFHKIKDKSVNVLIFENKQFNKNCTKEQIIKISRENKNSKKNFENMTDLIEKYEASINELNNIKNEINDIKKNNSELLKQFEICNETVDKQSKNFKKVRILSIVLISLFTKKTTEKIEKNDEKNKLGILDFIKEYIDFKENKLNNVKKIEYPIEKVTSFNIVTNNNENMLNISNAKMVDDLSIFNLRYDPFYNSSNDLNLLKNNSSLNIYNNFLME